MTNRAVGIYKRGASSWRIVVSAGTDPQTGRPVTIRETVNGTVTAAKKRRNELLTAVSRGTVARSGQETVAAFMERFIAHRQAAGKVRPKTANVYRGYMRREVVPRIGSLRLADVRPVHLQRVLDEATASGLSARSVLQVHRILSAAFRQAVRWQLVSVNPSDGVTPPKAEAPRLTMPTAAEIGRLLDAAQEQFRPALAVLAGTGIRRGELSALRWDGVDLDGPMPTLRVAGSMQRVAGRLQVLPPKTQRGFRIVPLPSSLVAVLKRVRSEQNERRLIAGTAWNAGEGYVFDRGDGEPLDPDALTHAFVAARTRSGVGGVRLHDLRHHFATLHMASGTNPRVVSDLLGHSNVAFTMMTYSHPDPQMAANAMQAIDGTLGDALADR
jgi:integrase